MTGSEKLKKYPEYNIYDISYINLGNRQQNILKSQVYFMKSLIEFMNPQICCAK